ncbi:MAG: amidohydrolase [Azoarcus sp.]|jgi:hippurate hydrolase|nr:amidohydrolase [Azoarcus sp.]
MTPLDSARQIRAALQTLRRDLHAWPELAFAETRTADAVSERLGAWGIETCRGLGGTGVVGTIRAGSGGRAIGLRADMDALPIAETNNFAHRSLHEGRMHGCGHDGHTAMLLGAARLLAERRDFDGTVHLIFQPGEEGAGGARAMIEDGLFTRFPMEAVYGMHNWPGFPAGHFAVHAGPVMAGTDRFDIHIEGVGGHAAMPHLAADPVLAGAALVQAVQSIVARSLDPLDAAVVSVTCFHAGETFNVLPGRAELSGTLRSFSAAVREKALDRLRGLCVGTGEAFGVKIVFDPLPGGYPPTINTVAEAAHCVEAASAVAGRENVRIGERPSMGAEDFAYYLLHKPGAYVWIGNGVATDAGDEGDSALAGCERRGSVALHNASYDFNDEILPVGAAYWIELVRRLLPRGGETEFW